MPIVTLGDLRARVRSMTDMGDSQFVTDSRYSLDAFINQAARELYSLVWEFGTDYAKRASLECTADTEEVTLPDDFRTLLAVEYEDEPIQQYGFNQSGVRLNGLEGQRAYRLESGSTMRIVPAPDKAGFLVRIYYYPAPPTLGLTSNPATETLEIFENGWEDLIIYRAAGFVAMKEERDYTGFMGMAEGMRERIGREASARSLTGISRIIDVSGWDDECL